jgi:hypothetical protein
MDGYKIRAKLALNFPRPVASTEAEEVMLQYARAFAAAIECELSNGDLPYEEHELLKRITDQVQALPIRNVRLIGLHVWHKGAVSSRSMLAVKPEGKPTIPTMPAVAQPRGRAMSSSPSLPAVTTRPPSSAAVTTPAPARAPASSAIPSSGTHPVLTQRAMPTARSATSTTTRAPILSNSTATPPPSSSQLSGASFPAAARMASGVVPAVDPRIVRSKSGFSIAVEQCVGATGEEVGRALAQPVRDAAAGVLLTTLDALHSGIADPLAMLDGRIDPELRRGLVGEACVCVCYVLYESLTRTTLPQMLSIGVVQGACVHALMDKAMPVSEISRYLATESPREEFSGRICALLGVRENAELQQRVESALRALRLDVRSCAEQIEQRLTAGKTLTGQKTG